MQDNVEETGCSGICPKCGQFVADYYSHYHKEKSMQPTDLSFFEPIKGLGTNMCLRIAVEAINYYNKIDKRTMAYKQLQTIAPNLAALCAEANTLVKETGDATV